MIYQTSKTPFGVTNERAKGSAMHVRNYVGVLPTDFHGNLYYPVPIRVPNLNAIGSAVLEIWNRHPARTHAQNMSQLTFARHPTNRSPPLCQIWAQSVQPFSRSGNDPCTCARALAPQLWHMELHCQVNAFMHAKFQRDRASNYGVTVIVRKLSPLHFCTWHVH